MSNLLTQENETKLVTTIRKRYEDYRLGKEYKAFKPELIKDLVKRNYEFMDAEIKAGRITDKDTLFWDFSKFKDVIIAPNPIMQQMLYRIYVKLDKLDKGEIQYGERISVTEENDYCFPMNLHTKDFFVLLSLMEEQYDTTGYIGKDTDEDTIKAFKRFKHLLKEQSEYGVHTLITCEEFAFACKPPQYIIADAEDIRNPLITLEEGSDKPSVIFDSGNYSDFKEQAQRNFPNVDIERALDWERLEKTDKTYYIYHIQGRKVANSDIEALKAAVVDGTIKEKYLTTENADTRAAFAAILGKEKLLEILGAKEIDVTTVVHKNGDLETLTLYKTDDIPTGFKELLSWVRFICPSTKANYLISVPPIFDSALEAAAYTSPFYGNEIKSADEYKFDVRG